MSKQNDELQANIDKAVARYKATTDTTGMSEEYIRFNAAMSKVFSVPKAELDWRLAEDKKAKAGAKRNMK